MSEESLLTNDTLTFITRRCGLQEPLVIDGIVHHVRKCTKRDFKVFPNSQHYKHGYAFTTVTVESRFFLPFLMNAFLERGGMVEQRTVQELEEVCG